MGWQNGSDIGIWIGAVARDGIRLEIARLPYAASVADPSRLGRVEATEESRHRWIQVASPPPPRVDGRPWYEAFQLNNPALPNWLQPASSTDSLVGSPKLARPSSESIVLDQQVILDADQGRWVECVRAEAGDPLGFAANYYPLPESSVEATAYIQCKLAWKNTLQLGAWIALSFDGFDPNAASTAFLAKVIEERLFPGSEAVLPKTSAAI